MTTTAGSDSDRTRVVVVVDPYSSGKYLVQELKEQCWNMVAVQSSLDLAEFWLEQLDQDQFISVVQHKDLATTMRELEAFEVMAVTPGSEPGVFLAEDIQESLKLEKRNGGDTVKWRRHKFDMQERLREVGVRAVRQVFAKDVGEVMEWHAGNNMGLWPIIVKPAMSGGTDGVFWCHCEEDVRLAFESECGKVNVNGELNDCLLAQEFLDGIEYIVDCVSNGAGKHVLCGIWQYKKLYEPASKSITYEYAGMLESQGEIQDQLVPYMFSVLD